MLSACKSGYNTTAPQERNPLPIEAASVKFRNRCQSPRQGIDPFTQVAYADIAGSSTDEKQWLHAWSIEDYLWYQELPDIDPTTSSSLSTQAYFSQLKTSAITASGKPKDSYHYAVPSDEYHRFIQQGALSVTWQQDNASGKIFLNDDAMTQTGEQVARGSELISLNGVAISDMNSPAEKLIAASSNDLFELQEPGSFSSQIVELQTAAATSSVQRTQVLTLESGRRVGYFSYTDHAFASESSLVNTVTQLKAAGIDDLVVDMRSNGGGAVYIASVVASMIADPALTQGKWFERSLFNDKHTAEEYPFFSTAYGVSYPNGQLIEGALAKGTPLPNLGLRRLYVLTSNDTCSASESVINSLRGVDMEVFQIGATTCGKPYGFLPQDNCGYTYSSINFHSVNAKNEGDYSDGLNPLTRINGKLAGCAVTDTYRYSLGNLQEPLLAAALYLIKTGQCPPSTVTSGVLPTLNGLRTVRRILAYSQRRKSPR